MIAARENVVRVTHFAWGTASVYPALSVVLLVFGRVGSIAPYFFYIMAVLVLLPVLELKVTKLAFDSARGELLIVRRVWWRMKSTSESYRTAGLTAIVWRHTRRTPGPPFNENTITHDRMTLAAFHDGREVMLFYHTWLPGGQPLADTLATRLGVDYRKEDTGVQGKFW